MRAHIFLFSFLLKFQSSKAKISREVERICRMFSAITWQHKILQICFDHLLPPLALKARYGQVRFTFCASSTCNKRSDKFCNCKISIKVGFGMLAPLISLTGRYVDARSDNIERRFLWVLLAANLILAQ